MALNHHRFGVNYTPTRSWWFCWNDFRKDAIAEDLDTIAKIGADHIRIMLVWPCFQPNPQAVSAAHLDRLNILMDLANQREIDVCAAVFVGWLSGYAFKPPFQKDDTFYDLTESKTFQELYLTSVADFMKEHSNFLGFDLGNELNCCWKTDELETGDHWNRHMLDLATRCAPSGVHVNGVGHNPWFSPMTFSPQQLAATQEIIALHCWTFFTKAHERSNGDFFSPRCLRLLESMAALSRSYADDPSKPVWIQEYGMSEEWMNPVDIPRFLKESTLNAIGTGVNWFTWWSSHDLDRRYAFSPLEYSLGLITHDQQIKPQGFAFKELAETYRGIEARNTKRIDLPAPPETFDMDSTWNWLDQWVEFSN